MKVLSIIIIFMMSIIFSNAQTSYLLIARNTGEKILATNDTIRVFGFATSLSMQPSIPGPTLYANEGDSVIIDLFNVSQGAPHTIHLHGLDVNQQNDGVGMLSFEVDHMDHGYYRFKAPHPGTYLYHCHVTSPIHVQAGMYGLVIIKPASGSDSTWTNGYAYNQDFSLLMSEIDTAWHNDSVLNHAHDTTMVMNYVEIPFYAPQFFLVNGLSDSQLPGNIELNSSVGEINYIRLSNLGFYANRVIFPVGLNAMIIDSDGRPLPSVELNDTIILFPGERYGIIAEANAQFIDSIQIEYLDLNTWNLMGEQYVKVDINGIFSVDENSNNFEIKIQPNPNQGNFQLTFSNHSSNEIKIEILDFSGRLIQKYDNCKMINSIFNSEITTNLFNSGMYFIRITDENNLVYVAKWILAP